MTTQQIADELNKNKWYKKRTVIQSRHIKFTAGQRIM